MLGNSWLVRILEWKTEGTRRNENHKKKWMDGTRRIPYTGDCALDFTTAASIWIQFVVHY